MTFFLQNSWKVSETSEESGTQKIRSFLSFYLVVIHLLSFPHLLLIFSHQTLPTDHSIVLNEVHRAAGCSDGAKDQNWLKRLNPFTILG